MPAVTELARLGARHGTVWTTEFQSAGTGRDRRAWIAAPGSALLMSLLIKTVRPLNEIPVVSLLIGGCVRDTVAEFGISSLIKWPNDILANRKKLCGILVRSSRSIHGDGLDLVVGIGLNLTLGSTIDLPEATNLEAESGRLIARDIVQNRLLEHIGRMSEEFECGEIGPRITGINNCLAYQGEGVSIQVGLNSISGTVEGVREDGALIVTTSTGGREYIVSGELQRGPIQQGPR